MTSGIATFASTEVRIRRLPEGRLETEDFILVDVELPPLAEGEILVRNEWMSLDPYMRLGLTQQVGYVSTLQPGNVMSGAAVGIVDQSRDSTFPTGAIVLSQMGWRTHFIAKAKDLAMIDPQVPPAWHLGFLGLTGVTAWIGIEEILCPSKGETVFISGAAGAVGSIACQLAKRRGAHVMCSASSDDKAAWLREEIGVDGVVNYQRDSVDEFLGKQAPDGVDCFFDNVGGKMLETLIQRMKSGGRIGLCGAMSQYQDRDYRAGPANFFAVIEKSLRLAGFNAFSLPTARWQRVVAQLSDLAKCGELTPCQSIVEGVENVPAAFAAMFAGGYRGKVVVRLFGDK